MDPRFLNPYNWPKDEPLPRTDFKAVPMSTSMAPVG